MTDHAAFPEPAELSEVPPGPDKLLSWVCELWLLNALIGAAVAIREHLPGELIAGVFTGVLSSGWSGACGGPARPPS